MYAMNLSIQPTTRGHSIDAVLYEVLDSGAAQPLAEIPPTEVPNSSADRDPLVLLLDCLEFWCRMQSRMPLSSHDAPLF